MRPTTSPRHTAHMRKFLIGLIVNALALWLTTLIVPNLLQITPYADGELAVVLTYLVVALLFGLVNGIIGTAIRIVAFPVYVLTLGLIALIVNAFLLYIVDWLCDAMGFGLTVKGEFLWDGVLAALIIAVLSWLIGLLLRPLR